MMTGEIYLLSARLECHQDPNVFTRIFEADGFDAADAARRDWLAVLGLTGPGAYCHWVAITR
jgi:hypothetical protein